MKNILLLLVLTISGSGCAWWQKCHTLEHRNDLSCAVVDNTVDCTEASVIQEIAQFKPIIEQLIAKAQGQNNQIDWNQVFATLTNLGIKDGGCLLAAIETDFLPTAALSSESPAMTAMKQSYRANYATFRQTKWPGIKFKIKKADGTTVTL